MLEGYRLCSLTIVSFSPTYVLIALATLLSESLHPFDMIIRLAIGDRTMW
jgi:hypothetical protein